MKASAMPANEFAPRPTSPGAYLYLLPVFTALIAAVWLGELPGPYIRQLQNVDMWLQHNKVNNLKLAVDCINGLVIAPGETFSFWYLIGKPTHKRGYLKGRVLCNGSFRPGIGGGLCQLSNLNWMTLQTSLTVKERWRHNFDVFPDADRTQPFGSGTTVVYNYVDLQICNDTDSDYQLIVWLDENYLYGEWRSQEAPLYTYKVY